ncbi:MAG: ECF transporter S component [Bacillota bacterium]|jgi:niacin transporter|nr:ECF transporter S component [Candidatus Fermentithermobacillaceae bacterium]
MKSKETLRLTAGSLLLAVSLLIPSLLGGVVTLPIGPFTATPASHVPTLLSMLLGPVTAGIVGMGSAIGFFLRLGPLVGARAAMHIPVGVTGAWLMRKGMGFPLALSLMAPLHAGLEALIVLLFGFSLRDAGFVVGLGTLVHHIVDSAIALFIWRVVYVRTPLADLDNR